MTEDIRWKQRLENYSKALGQLTRFIEKGELTHINSLTHSTFRGEL
jgi:hypothetical protein